MIKNGVDLRGLTPQMAIAYTIATKCYGQYDCVITSANDSKHGPFQSSPVTKDGRYRVNKNP